MTKVPTEKNSEKQNITVIVKLHKEQKKCTRFV